MAEQGDIIVPMLVDVYVNYPSSVTSNASLTPSRPSRTVHLAPSSLPDYQVSLLDNGGTQHDMYDSIRPSPYGESADPFQVNDARGGLYVHWSLPPYYRSGSAASDSATDADDSNASQATYPPVPNKWLISRVVKCLSGSHVEVVWNGKRIPYYNATSNDLPSNIWHNRFLVESDYPRNLSDTSSQEDLEVTCSPYIVRDEATQSQKRIFLGRHTFLTENYHPEPYSAPKVDVGSTANPFFADYQPHNESVFSWFDDMMSPNPYCPGRFINVSVSYTVIGFHGDLSQDPLQRTKDNSEASVQQLLDDCDFVLLNEDSSHITQADNTFLASTTDVARTVCHGSRLSTPWLPWPTTNTPISLSLNYPGDAVQTALLRSHPVAVGTNPIDALCGWFRSKLTSEVSASASASQVNPALTKLPTLLADLTNTFDTQLEAGDILGSQNYVRTAGGPLWYLAPSTPATTQEDQDTPKPPLDVDGLRNLNGLQRLLNALCRKQAFTQRNLFYGFWKYATQRNRLSEDQIKALAGEVQNCALALSSSLLPGITVVSDTINKITISYGNLMKGTEPPFYIQRDPTLLVAGLQSKWPVDFDENTQVRLSDQVNGENPASHTNYWGYEQYDLPRDLDYVAPDNPILKGTLTQLIDEAENLIVNRQRANPPVPPLNPIYHPSRDQFTGDNAWFPLFIDWEVEYYHIPFSQWTFEARGSQSRVQYGLGEEDVSQVNNGDFKVISGRSPILPQSSSHLKAMLGQLLARLPAALLNSTKTLNTDQFQSDLLNAIMGLDFLSTPMSGFTDQMVTQMQGTHLAPLDYGTYPPTATQDAITIGKEIGLTADQIALMGAETQCTPFADTVPVTTSFCPFKPCTHGQFRFRKLDVVDKFGQVASAVLPVRDPNSTTPPYIDALFPGLGGRYSLDSSNGVSAASVLPRTDGRNTFVQLPPSINQNARASSGFVKRVTGGGWTMTDEWDNPVIGWIILNNADNSFQVFTADGSFVREFCLPPSGGTGAAVVKPIDMDSSFANVDNIDLQNFLTAVMSTYPMKLWNLLAKTALCKHSAPTAFSGSMLSAMGRPLALVNMGFRVELADQPFVNQSTTGSVKADSVLDYNFTVKYGDQYNNEDGFYGYWLPASSNSTQLDYSKFYSYDVDDPSDPNVQPIALYDKNFKQTYKVSYPDPQFQIPSNNAPDLATAVSSFQSQQDSQLSVISTLIDPYIPTHITTDLLPISEVQLPAPAISDSLSRIAAFMSAGPILIPSDIPAYDPKKQVSMAYRLNDDPSNPDGSFVPTNGSLPIPAVPGADWAWLQPYWQPGARQPGQMQGTTVLNAMDVTAPKPGANFEAPPYVAVEGYLQMKKPFQQPNEATGGALEKVRLL